MAFSQIPYATEQGIFFRDQGNVLERTGKFLSESLKVRKFMGQAKMRDFSTNSFRLASECLLIEEDRSALVRCGNSRI